MIAKVLWRKKAIPAVMAGIAFFLMSCQPKIAPKGKIKEEESALVLHRTAETHSKANQYEKALGFFKRVHEEYPRYTKLAEVRYQIARNSYLLGEHENSGECILEWIEEYPRHSLKPEALILAGENFKALGDDLQAFYWWLKAEDEYTRNPQIQKELKNRIEELIESGGIEKLELYAEYAIGSDHAPRIYHRMASLLMENNEPEKAKKALIRLIESAPDQSWVSKGRQLLASIQKGTSVRPGVVGCLLPLSGPFAIYGQEVLNGIQLGMGLFGETGDGIALELVIRDTKGTAEQTVDALEDMVKNERVMAVIGPLSSRTAVVAAQKAQTLGVPMITLTQREGIVEEGPMILRNFLTPSREVKRLVDAAVTEMGMKRFGILYPDNPYGQHLMNLFWDSLEEMGGIVTALESYDPDSTDFANQIKKMTGLFYPRPESMVERLKEMTTPEEEESETDLEEPEPIIDFDAVFIPDNYQRVAMIAPQLVYYDVVGILLMGTSLWQSPQLIDLARDYVQGAVFSSGFFERSGEPGIHDFVESYRANFDCAPGVLAATGYDTIRLLKNAIKKRGVYTRKDLQTALLQSPEFQGVTGTSLVDLNGDIRKEPLLMTISGRYMTVLY